MSSTNDTYQQLLTAIQSMSQIPFDSPTRAAVVVTRFSFGLPRADAIPGLSPIERMYTSVMRTIRHSHGHEHFADQDGDGWWFTFRRHVTEGGEQWRYEVEVRVRRDERIEMVDVRLERPDDRDEETDPIDLNDAATPGEGMLACPCCGHATLSTRGEYEICPVCFWEDDGQDNADASGAGSGANSVSLIQGRINYLALGASVEEDVSHVRPATLEEVPLRRFDASGVELAP